MTDDVERYLHLPYKTRILTDECDGELCYIGLHPELPGCMAQGFTPQEALANLDEARRDYIAALLDEGIEVPRPEVTPMAPSFEIIYPRAIRHVQCGITRAVQFQPAA